MTTENNKRFGYDRSDLEGLKGTIIPVLAYRQKNIGGIHKEQRYYIVQTPITGDPGREVTHLERFRSGEELIVGFEVFLHGGLSHDGQFGFYGVRDEIRMRRLLESGS